MKFAWCDKHDHLVSSCEGCAETFTFFESELFKPREKSYPMEEDFRSEGRCPKCGELGRIHMSQFICSFHGPY